jgi:hypothetical protein
MVDGFDEYSSPQKSDPDSSDSASKTQNRALNQKRYTGSSTNSNISSSKSINSSSSLTKKLKLQ